MQIFIFGKSTGYSITKQFIMKHPFILIFAFMCCKCSTKQSNNFNVTNTNTEISTKDSLFVEDEVSQYKNCLFSDMYFLSRQKSFKRQGIKERDSMKDLTYYNYQGNFNPQFMLDDPNRTKMFDKWLKDGRYDVDSEIIGGSLDIVRSLDFYNSNDLKKYIDSLKIVEYKRIIDRQNKH